MNEPRIEAAYLHTLRTPVLMVGAITHTLSLEQTEDIALQLQHAALHARLAKRAAEIESRMRRSGDRLRSLHSQIHPTAIED